MQLQTEREWWTHLREAFEQKASEAFGALEALPAITRGRLDVSGLTLRISLAHDPLLPIKPDQWLVIKIHKDEASGCWVVSEDRRGGDALLVHGTGATILDAIEDFAIAFQEHYQWLQKEENRLGERLAKELKRFQHLTGSRL